MLRCDSIDVYYFLKVNCHDLMQKTMSVNNVAIDSVKKND